MAAAPTPRGSRPPGVASSQRIALVELFTSEGCSSCPPADGLLARLVEAYRGRPAVFVSFHVDYWNDLGWQDPFSKSAFSERQRRYARALGERGVYTPQMVVGGTEGFVGSRQMDAERAIDAALRAAPRGRLELGVTRARDVVRVRLEARDVAPHARAVVVAVRDRVEVEVPRGENAGQRLRHVNVVRALSECSLDAEGRCGVELGLPDDLTASEAQVFGWVAHPETLAVEALAAG